MSKKEIKVQIEKGIKVQIEKGKNSPNRNWKKFNFLLFMKRKNNQKFFQ